MAAEGHDDLHAAALRCLREGDPARKAALARETAARVRAGALLHDEIESVVATVEPPGRPARPVLVSPRQLPQRGLGSPEGRAAFVHAIAHIEFNAIDLAWDAVYRFRGLPAEFYADWVGVADDEARHF